MKTVKNTVLLLIAVIGMSASVDAQSILNIKNGSGCAMNFKVKYATAPCTGGTTIISLTVAAYGSDEVTIPANNSVRNVRVNDGSSDVYVSNLCTPTWANYVAGGIECSGTGLIVDYTDVETLSVYE